jgi:hypothetical protein
MQRHRPHAATLLCLLLSIGPATADPNLDACAKLGEKFDALGFENGQGRHWTV